MNKIKVKALGLIISNLFMLSILPIFKILKLEGLIKIIVNQAIRNTDYVTNLLGGNNNE